MDKESYEIRIRQWAEIIRAANESGLTRNDWCAQNNISLRVFYYWHKRVRNHVLQQQESMSPGVAGSETLPQTTGKSLPVFCEITGPTVPEPVPVTAVSLEKFVPEAMLQLGRYGLFLNSNISESTLSTILSVLRNA